MLTFLTRATTSGRWRFSLCRLCAPLTVIAAKADLVLVIPPQYGRRQTGSNGERAQLLIAANAVNGTKGSIGSSYLSQMVSEEGEMKSSQLASALFLYNKHQDYKVFMIPALAAIAFVTGCWAVLSYRKNG